MGSGFAKRKKQAKQLQDQVMQMQEKMGTAEVVGKAGNGLVTVTLNGHHEIKGLDIKRECVDPEDIEGLKLLIIAAFQDATEQLNKQSMQGIPPGLGAAFPGMF